MELTSQMSDTKNSELQKHYRFNIHILKKECSDFASNLNMKKDCDYMPEYNIAHSHNDYKLEIETKNDKYDFLSRKNVKSQLE